MAGIWLSDAVGPLTASWRNAIIMLPAIALAALLSVLWRRAPRHVLLVLISVIAATAGLARHQQVYDRPPHHIAHALADEPVLTRLVGRIVTTPIERPPLKLNPFLPFNPAPRTQFVLAVEELRTTDPPVRATGNLRVSIDASTHSLYLGQRVQLTGRIWRLFGPQNPGQVDWSRWYRHQGIDAGMTVEGIVHIMPLPDPIAWWPRLVTGLRQTVQSLLYEPYADLDTDEFARLLDVMILGQRSTADRALNEAFLRAGGMQFLAVSGFNVMVLALAAWWVVRLLPGTGVRLAATAAILAIFTFTLVTEPNAPILRGATGVALLVVAWAIGRPVCALNSLSLAGVGILLSSPNELFRAAFQLTFVQVAVLIVVVPRVYGWVFRRHRDEMPAAAEAQTVRRLALRVVIRWTAELALVCLCMWASALPLVLWHFGRFTPWGWLGSLLLTPLVIWITVLSLAATAAKALLALLATLLGLVLQRSIDLLPLLGTALGFMLLRSTDALLWSVRLFEHLPGAIIDCQPPPAWLVAASYVALFMLVVPGNASGSAQGPRPRRPIRGLTLVKINAVALLLLAWLGWIILPASRGVGHAVHVLAAGDGNAILLTAPDGSAAVLDVGTDTNSDIGETAARALRAVGVRRVDDVLVSHANLDHYSGLPTLLDRLPVERWLTNAYFASQCAAGAPEELLARLPPLHRQPGGLHAGDQLRIGDATLDVLWPPEGLGETWTVNDRSLAIRVTADGQTLLLTGDLEARGLSALLTAEQCGQVSLRADVLIAPHHGQVLPGVTERFYAAVSPRVVIVSTRTPRPKLAALVADTLGPTARVLLTGEVGAVTVRISPAGELFLETPCAPGTAR
jgi:competence protein ComEC